MVGWVLLKIVCLLMRWLFSLAVLMSSGDREKDAELLVLRHENAVLRRNADPVRYEPADRARFAALLRFMPRRRWAEVFPVTPATPLAWHRRLAARTYDTSKRRRPGRSPTIRSIARLAVRLAHENLSRSKIVNRSWWRLVATKLVRVPSWAGWRGGYGGRGAGGVRECAARPPCRAAAFSA